MTRSESTAIPAPLNEEDEPPVSPTGPVGRNLVFLGSGQATTFAMALLWSLVVPRLLGPAGMGLVASVWAVAAILSIFVDLGTQSYLARELVARPASASDLLGTALVLRVLTAPVFLVAAVVFAHFAHYGRDARLVLWLAAGATLFTLLDAPLLSAFQAAERMQYMAYSDVINQSAQGLVGIAVVVVGLGAVGLTATWFIVSILVLVLGLRWIQPLVRITYHTSVRQLTSMVRASISYLALGLSGLVYTWIDTVMLSLLTRNQVVGWYSVPTKLLGALVCLPVIISTAWAPRLVRAFEESGNALKEAAARPIELAMVLSLPVAAITALCAKPFIPLLYGAAYQRSVPVMVILGLTCIPMYANIILSTVLVAMRRQGRLTLLMGAAALVNPTLNFFFIRLTEHRYQNGAIGAAICLLLTELLVASGELILVGRRFLSSPSVFRVMRAAVASGAMWAVGHLAQPLGWYVSLPLAGLTFVVLVIILRIMGPSEKEALRAVVAAVTVRLHANRPRHKR